MRADQLYNILLTPIFSEKSTAGFDSGKYAFKVAKFSKKSQIATAIEKVFDVKVAKINVINTPSKEKLFKRVKGVRSGFKKAIVTLQPGFSMDLMSFLAK
jgi:large subunit ribosomal protein L23